MKRIKLILVMFCIGICCSGIYPYFSEASGFNYSQKIVIFHDDVSWEDVKLFADEWKVYGVLVLKELPIINGLVLKIPEDISVSNIADDLRVESIEDDQKVIIQSDVQGQYASFIEPATTPPSGYYPWGILSLYGQDYDSWLLTSPYEKDDLHELVWGALKQLDSINIKIAVFDTGIAFSHKNLRKVVKGGIDIVNPDRPLTKIERRKNGAPFDDNGHGTHIAGIISAALDHKRKWGRHAQIELYAVKVLNEYAMGDLSNIIMGLQWAINNNIDIVNMSIAYREDSSAVRKAIKVAHKLGLIMVASIGNRSNWDDMIILAADGGAADGGAADGGAADGGAADGGAADGGAADGGAADGGAADGGAADGGAADGGAADGGAADGGAADGGAADGGAADGGAADGGAADGAAADGGAADGGAADGAAADGGAIDYYSEALGEFSVMYPARYPEVIAVGAVTPYGEFASYNNNGKEIDVLAPGSNILSTDVTNGNIIRGYGFCSGTSQATAHVTAAVALMLSLDPSLSPEEIENIIESTATPAIGVSSVGRINLTEALERLSAKGNINLPDDDDDDDDDD